MYRFLLILITFSFFGCHTYVWQPIEKQIIGEWVVIPTEREIHRWYIDKETIIVKIDANCIDTVYYTIDTKLTKHILNAQFDARAVGAAGAIEQWQFVRMNKDEMYLSSIDPPRFGNVQVALVKVPK